MLIDHDKSLPGGVSVRDVPLMRSMDVYYAVGWQPAHYPVPAIIYTPVLEEGTLWEFKGTPDDIRSRYPTHYRIVKNYGRLPKREGQ